MKLLVEDLKEPKAHIDIVDLLSGVTIVSQGHWEAINTAEIAAGEVKGKPRVKVVDHSTLLHLGGL
jgi:ferredoxin--NADP+ reductase